MKKFTEIINEIANTKQLNEAYIDLDYVNDRYKNPKDDPEVKRFNLTTKMVNPKTNEFRFTGKQSNIKKYLIVYNGGDKEEAKDMEDMIMNEATQSGNDTEFENLGGGFKNRGLIMSFDEKDEMYIQPGTYSGGKKPKYIIKVKDKKDKNKIETQLDKIYKKIADMVDSTIVKELQKLGFKKEN